MKLDTGRIARVPEAFPSPEKSAALKYLTDTVRLHFNKNSDWRDEIRNLSADAITHGATADEIAAAFIAGLPAKY